MTVLKIPKWCKKKLLCVFIFYKTNHVYFYSVWVYSSCLCFILIRFLIMWKRLPFFLKHPRKFQIKRWTFLAKVIHLKSRNSICILLLPRLVNLSVQIRFKKQVKLISNNYLFLYCTKTCLLKNNWRIWLRVIRFNSLKTHYYYPHFL